MKLTLNLLVMMALATGCGSDKKDRENTDAEDKNKDKTGDTGTGSGDTETDALVEDEEAAGESIAAQIDEAVSQAAEDNEGTTGAGLSLTEVSTDGEHKRYRKCEEQDSKAVVTIVRSANRTITFEGPQRTATSEFSASDERTRTWSRAEGEVKCAANGLHADLPPADMEGVTLNATFKHARSRSQTVQNKQNGKSFSRSMNFTSEGTRTAVIKSVTETEDSWIGEKEVTGEATRTLKFKNKNGEEKSMTQSLKNVEGAPLVISVERSKDGGAFVSRTIKSGSLVATGKNGGRIVTTFADVVYNREKRCAAVSGKISGEIYVANETSPALTYEITFGTDGRQITFSNGTTYEYAPEGCAFDEPEKVEDVASAEAAKDQPVADSTASDAQAGQDDGTGSSDGSGSEDAAE